MKTKQLETNNSKPSTLTALTGIVRLCALGAAAALLPAQSALANSTRILPSPTITVSTIPANANVNPYVTFAGAVDGFDRPCFLDTIAGTARYLG